MAIVDIITANCENGKLSQGTIARRWDDKGTLIQFAGYPEPDDDEQLIYRLIVWMKASEDADPSELPPIELEADQWLVSNVYTQLAQTIRFQLCITNEAGTYEKHSPIFAGNIGKSLSHNGEEADIDVSELFDPYKKYVDELVVAAGAVVIDEDLDTAGAAADAKATGDALTGLNERLREQGEIVNRLNEGGLDIKDNVIEAQINEWLNEHPEATTTVQDGSLTHSKLVRGTLGFVTPEMYGAEGDGSTDDTAAVQSALNYAGLVIFGSGKTYSVTRLRVKAHTIIDLNRATIVCNTLPSVFNFEDTDAFTAYNGNGNIVIKNGTIRGGTVSFAHGENVLFKNVIFKNTLGNHFLEICACKNFTVFDCVFSGMSHTGGTREYINFDQCDYTAFPWFTEGSASYDGTVNKNIKILNNFFDKGETGYTDCQWAMGCHYVADSTKLHEDVVISGNTIEGYMSNCIRLQAFKNSVVEGNTLTSAGRPFYVGYGKNNRIVNNYALVSANSAFAGFTAPEESIYIDGNSIAAEDNRAFVTRTFAAGTLTGVTFKKLQKSYIGAAESGELQTSIPLTSLHKVSAFVGTLENANARWVTIEAYPDRKFQLGESYAYLNIDTSMNVAARNFTIDSEDGTKATTITTFRYVYGEV